MAFITGAAHFNVGPCERMGLIQQTFRVRAPLAVAWRYGLQSRRIPEWQPGIVRVRAPAQIDRVGITYDLVYRYGPLRSTSHVSVVEFEHPSLIAIAGTAPLGTRFQASTRMRSVDSSTEINYRMEYALPGGTVGRWFDRAILGKAYRDYVFQTNLRLKMAIEAEAGAARSRLAVQSSQMPGDGAGKGSAQVDEEVAR